MERLGHAYGSGSEIAYAPGSQCTTGGAGLVDKNDVEVNIKALLSERKAPIRSKAP